MNMAEFAGKPFGLSQPQQIYTLHPGDVACGERGDRLDTLLGSCVAIILTDPRRTIGAMCHIVHAGPSASSAPASATYADVALATMYRLLRDRGIDPTQCEAYLYGGGNMFPDLLSHGHVGERNARWVCDALAEDGVRVLAQDLGGCAYRRLSWTVGIGAPQVTSVPI